MNEKDENDGLDENGDPICDGTGLCKAMKGARDITNCIYCGKELHEKDGHWWTHDADQFPDPEPQDIVR